MLSNEYVAKRGERYCRYSVVERVRLVNRRDYISRVRTDCVKRKVGSFPDRRRGRGLAFDCHRPLSFLDDKVYFGSGGIFQYIYVVFQASSCLQPCKFNSYCGNCKDKIASSLIWINGRFVIYNVHPEILGQYGCAAFLFRVKAASPGHVGAE